MTDSRSNAARTMLLAVLVVLCAILGTGGVAQAGRKRVVVLDFEGPKGDKFHDDLVKLIKKTHTVVPTEKWNGTAEELDASAVSEKNIKKVAKKLKIDAVVEGKIEKRRDDFIIRLKLHEGRSGGLVGNTIDTKAQGPRIDGKAQRDLKDELVDAIDNIESNHLGGSSGDEDDDAKPSAKKAARKTDDDDRPFVKKGAKQTDDDEDKPVKKRFSKPSDDERGNDKVDNNPAKKADDDDKLPAKKLAKKPAKQTDDDDKLPAKTTGDSGKRATKKVASSDDDEDGTAEAEVDTGAPLGTEAALSPGERALDAVVGLSLTARRMSFAFVPTLLAKPPGYAGTPVAGGMIDATFYPLALGHKRTDMLKNIGLNLMYDRVFKISSKDPMTGNVFDTTEARFAIGATFRYAFNKTAMAPVVIGSLGYSSQAFTITPGAGQTIDIPNVKYSILEPGAGLRYPVTPKVILGVDAKLMVITSAGPIQDPTQYGTASVLGFESAAGVDYLITPNIFARAALRFETIGYTFNGTGMQSNGRDGNLMTQDVAGARDSYIGGIATIGYLY